MLTFVFSDEVCDVNFTTYVGDVIMCPLCDIDCTYWKLESSCTAAIVSICLNQISAWFYRTYGEWRICRETGRTDKVTSSKTHYIQMLVTL